MNNTAHPTGEPANKQAGDIIEALRSSSPHDFDGVVVEGDVDLSEGDFPNGLKCKNVTFSGGFKARNARFGKSVELSGCTFTQDIDLYAARIDGDLVLVGARIETGAEERQKPADKRRPANFERIQVGGNFNASQLFSEATINCRKAKVCGDCRLNGVELHQDLDFINAQIDSLLECKPENDRRPFIRGHAKLTGTKVGGQAVFSGVEIGGDLNLQDAEARDLFCIPNKL